MHLRDAPSLQTSVGRLYADRVRVGALSADPAQEKIVRALDRLAASLSVRALARKSSALGWLFARKPDAASAPKGLYIHGGVGRGKTMLMDLFFEIAPIKAKKRIHFNAFMADVHDRIQRHRQARRDGKTNEDDPISPVARQIASEAQLLCFDEFSITDIADAMILSRLFSALFGEGVVLVATSNVAPDDLYRDGLNRALFEPFVSMLKTQTDMMALDSETDYRLKKLNAMALYMTPLGAEADRHMDEAWATVTHKAPATSASIAVKGRRIAVPRASGTAARFTFAELCETPLAARDYLAIADRFRTVFVDHITVVGDSRRNEAKRLILLIDTLYDRRVRLFASAAAAPDDLYDGTTGNEPFEFRRTASRLIEMQSQEWLDAWKVETQQRAESQPSVTPKSDCAGEY